MTKASTQRQFFLHEDLVMLVRAWAHDPILNKKRFFFPLENEMREYESALRDKLRSIFEPLKIAVTPLPARMLRNDLMSKVQMENKSNYHVVCCDELLRREFGDFYVNINRQFSLNQSGDKCVHISHGPRTPAGTIEEQIRIISQDERLRRRTKNKKVVLVDDFLWTGMTMYKIVELFRQNGVAVDRIFVSAVGREQRQEFVLPEVEVVSIIQMAPQNIYDFVSARDFLPGIPYGGMGVGYKPENKLQLIGMPDGLAATKHGKETAYYESKEPVISGGQALLINFCFPFISGMGGVSWASIPAKKEIEFSVFCVEQAIKFYEAVERYTAPHSADCSVLIEDVPRIPYLWRKERRRRIVDALNDHRRELARFV